MSPLALSNPTIAGPEHYNIAEAQDKALKIAFIKMIEVFKEKTSKSLK